MPHSFPPYTLDSVWTHLCAVREQNPLVHNITNLVVMHTTANALLAVGASPVMAHAPEEIDEIVGISSALVLNIGTLTADWVLSMHSAIKVASARGMPVVIDPVGAGASRLRTRTARELLEACPDAVLRGNASEIAAVAGFEVKTKGVDSTAPAVDGENAALFLSEAQSRTVCVSGAVDLLTGDGRVFRISGGSPLMPRVTGMGCSASALIGAFTAAVPHDVPAAAASAMAVMSAAGHLAARNARGPGSFLGEFFDALYSIDRERLEGAVAVWELPKKIPGA